jgi:hypothetical protein
MVHITPISLSNCQSTTMLVFFSEHTLSFFLNGLAENFPNL